MTVGERGPSGDHGQAGDPGRHGEHGKPGEPGPAGPTGAQGKSGVTPWVVRQANIAYIMLAAGLFVSVLVSQYQVRTLIEEDTKVKTQFEQEGIANDRDFCELSRESRTAINANREAIRQVEGALRQSFEMVQAAPTASPAERARVTEFRARILATLDGIKVAGNLDLPDCSTIGDGSTETSITPD